MELLSHCKMWPNCFYLDIYFVFLILPLEMLTLQPIKITLFSGRTNMAFGKEPYAGTRLLLYLDMFWRWCWCSLEDQSPSAYAGIKQRVGDIAHVHRDKDMGEQAQKAWGHAAFCLSPPACGARGSCLAPTKNFHQSLSQHKICAANTTVWTLPSTPALASQQRPEAAGEASVPYPHAIVTRSA